MCVPTKWACDITRNVTKSAIPEILRVLEKNGIVIDARDRERVFKLFDIEYVGCMSGSLRKGDKSLLYWQDVVPDEDELFIIGDDDDDDVEDVEDDWDDEDDDDDWDDDDDEDDEDDEDD